jgi:asparagine synthase (glutamine-hydrolysing)
MCGIVGVLHELEPGVRESVALGMASLVHRGPDDGGISLVRLGKATLGLGHRRLSILDLSPLGRQPMLHGPSGCQIIFNGEIYNYRTLRRELERDGELFRGGSDTEVLLAGLARHGEPFLKRLEGMFAFGFFDPRSPSLLLGRDPAGIKPLYLAESGTSLVFASEVRAILATKLVEPRIDRRGVAGFLAYGAVQHPCTAFAGITSLAPGTSIEIRPTESGRWQHTGPPRVFWRLPPTDPGMTEADTVIELRARLEAAVQNHLVADVPIGLFLSSGLDSTILAGLAGAIAPALKSFTVSFSDQPEVGEQRIASETARMFGLEHRELAISNSTAKTCFEDWLAALDEPSLDGLNVFAISGAVREKGIKVALSGLGADELFGGYPSFRDVPRLGRLAKRIRTLPAHLRRGLAGIATVGRSRPVREKLRDMLGSDGSIRSMYFHRRRAMSNSQLRQIGIERNELGLGAEFLSLDSLWDVDDDEADPKRQISQLELRCYQGNMLLRDADANGMAFGLEIRVPFLDQRVLDLANSIPSSVRFPAHAKDKHLLRAAFPDLLRPAILNQRKLGFTLPIGKWMSGDLRPICDAALDWLKTSGVVRAQGVQAVWNSFLAAPASQTWSRALSLVVLGDFLRRTKASV